MEKSSATFYSYLSGFIISVVLTLAAYVAVIFHGITKDQLVTLVLFLALLQLYVQLTFFLHVDKEKRPRWQLSISLYTVVIVAILVLGSLWIMKNLNYNMTPAQVNSYMTHQDGF